MGSKFEGLLFIIYGPLTLIIFLVWYFALTANRLKKKNPSRGGARVKGLIL
jgi:hypothetical protein